MHLFKLLSSAACWVGQNHSESDAAVDSLWHGRKPGVHTAVRFKVSTVLVGTVVYSSTKLTDCQSCRFNLKSAFDQTAI